MGGRGNQDAVEGDHLLENAGSSLRTMFWNVCGWARSEFGTKSQSVNNLDMRAMVFGMVQLDVDGVAEAWLKDGDVAALDGYSWFGHNRQALSGKAVRGLGGVGVFVRNALLNDWAVEVVDAEVEDILWLKLECSKVSSIIVLAVCYLPSMSSSRGLDVYERLSQLEEQVENFAGLGTVVICGDFNSRCGCLKDVDGDIVLRNVIDEVKTEQGEVLVTFLRSFGLCLVNGRVGQDNFTCISSKGCSVVDYCLVFQEDLNMVSQFQGKTMAEGEEEGGMDFEAQRDPDHSVLTWNLALARSEEVHAQRVRSGVEGGTNRHFIVPRGYLSGEEAAINRIAEEFQSMDKDQIKLNDVYANLMELMASGLVEVRSKRRFHAKAVCRVKREYEQSMRTKMEETGSGDFWKCIMAAGLTNNSRCSVNLEEVYTRPTR